MGRKFDDLKKTNQAMIQNWLYDAYCTIGGRLGRTPTRTQQEEIVSIAYGRAMLHGIEISKEEVRRYYVSKTSRFRKKFERGELCVAG